MPKYLLLIVLIFGVSSTALGQDPVQDNAEIAAAFESDQEIRRNFPREATKLPAFISRMIVEDKARLARTAELLNEGALRTANDFYHAAFIYQHGGEPSHYLLAHTLAVAAAVRGHKDAGWIAAASLDRYLQAIGHPQIYGTQTSTSSDGDATQEPYDRDLVPLSLRMVLGVDES